MDYGRYENALLDQAVHAATATAREKRDCDGQKALTTYLSNLRNPNFANAEYWYSASIQEIEAEYQTSEDLALDEILTKAWESAANVGPPSTEFMERHRTALREYRASFRGSGDDFLGLSRLDFVRTQRK